MGNIKRFITKARRNYIGNEMYVFGMIQGLEIAICDHDKETLGCDCELFNNFCLFITDTTQERFDRFCNLLEAIYPGLCEYKVEEL